jgi:hypothetical protein
VNFFFFRANVVASSSPFPPAFLRVLDRLLLLGFLSIPKGFLRISNLEFLLLSRKFLSLLLCFFGSPDHPIYGSPDSQFRQSAPICENLRPSWVVSPWWIFVWLRRGCAVPQW